MDVGATFERLAGIIRMLVVLVVGTARGAALSVALVLRAAATQPV